MPRINPYNPVTNSEKWLTLTAIHFKIDESDITGSHTRHLFCVARCVFYSLCLRDRINVYELSKYLNKRRCAVQHTLTYSKTDISQHIKTILCQMNKSNDRSTMEELETHLSLSK